MNGSKIHLKNILALSSGTVEDNILVEALNRFTIAT